MRDLLDRIFNRRRKAFRNTPTLDMYFRLPLADLIAEDDPPDAQRPIHRIGDNCFIAHAHGVRRGVIIRYATRHELRQLRAANLRSCTYLIDDDIYALEQDTSLPADYRKRLLRFRQRVLPDILALSNTIVAPNERILANYPGKQHHLLHPAPVHIREDFSHFTADERIRIVFTGSRSHLRDLEFIAPAIADICRTHPEVHFTTFLGRHAPTMLRSLPNTTHLPPQPWDAYRHTLATHSFHIALAPFLDTPFNRARSISKVLDHAAFGAAGIYSAGFMPCELVQHCKHGLCVENTSQTWHAALQELITAYPARPRELAMQAAAMLQELQLSVTARTCWVAALKTPHPPSLASSPRKRGSKAH